MSASKERNSHERDGSMPMESRLGAAESLGRGPRGRASRLRGRLESACGGALVLLALGCGKGASQATASAPSHSASPDQSSLREAEPEVLPLAPAPVTRPAGVVLRAKISRPLLITDRFFQAAGLPFRAHDFLDEVEEGDFSFGLPLRELDMTGSFEALIAMDPGERLERPRMLASAGVPSLRSALEALEDAHIDVVEGPAGIYYYSHDKSRCALGRALGSSPYRAVCGSDEESLSGYVKYALAGLPTEELGSSLGWFELDFAPIRAKYGSRAKGLKLLASVGSRQLHLDHPRFDRALTDAAVALAEEAGDLLQDVDILRGEFHQTERGDVTLRVGLEAGQMTSWYVQALGDLVRPSRPVPNAFWSLPGSVSAASFGYGLPAERTTKMRSILVDLAAGALEAKGAPKPLVRDVEVFVEEGFTPPEVYLQASGPVALGPDGKSLPAWGLYATSRPREAMVRMLDSLGKIARAPYWKSLDEKVDGLFTLERVKETVKGAPNVTLFHYELSEKAVERLRELDDLDADIPRGRLEGARELSKKLSLSGYVAVDTLGALTAVVYAKDKRGIAEAFRSLRSDQGPTLREQPTLQEHLARPVPAFAFAKVSGWVGIYALFLPDDIVERAIKLAESTPNGGEVPLYASWTGQSDGTRLSYRVDYEVPAAFIGDVAALLGLLAAEFKVD